MVPSVTHILSVVCCLQLKRTLHMLCDHRTDIHFCLPLTSRQHPVVPAERRPSTCPVAAVGQCARDSSGRLLGASACTRPAEKQKRATWEALFSLVHKSQGKRKSISCPEHPRRLASFPPPLSLQQTNIVEDLLLQRCHDHVSELQNKISNLKVTEVKKKKKSQTNLKAPFCLNINEHV